eukprot:1585033-Pleurochrysis_carterae.AAC.1
MHPTHQTLDDHVWVATLDENWGVDLWPAMPTQASEPDLSTMTHLCELICSNLLRNMESDATSVDVSRVVSILGGSLLDGFSDLNDPDRARFPQLHQPANTHREARTHTVLIADTGSRSYPDHANPAHLTAADVPAAREDRVFSRIPRYAGAGSRSGRAYFHWNPVNNFVSAIEV